MMILKDLSHELIFKNSYWKEIKEQKALDYLAIIRQTLEK